MVVVSPPLGRIGIRRLIRRSTTCARRYMRQVNIYLPHRKEFHNTGTRLAISFRKHSKLMMYEVIYDSLYDDES